MKKIEHHQGPRVIEDARKSLAYIGPTDGPTNRPEPTDGRTEMTQWLEGGLIAAKNGRGLRSEWSGEMSRDPNCVFFTIEIKIVINDVSGLILFLVSIALWLSGWKQCVVKL